MSAQTILAAVEEDLRRLVPDITFGYGRAAIATHGSPPRVTWVPAAGSFGPYLPADLQDDDEADAPDPVHTDRATFEVHCWADSDENGRDAKAERLGHRVIASIRRTLTGGHYELGPNTRDVADNNGTQGWLYLFVVTLVIPVLDEAPDTATLNEMPFDTSEAPPIGVLQAPGD